MSDWERMKRYDVKHNVRYFYKQVEQRLCRLPGVQVKGRIFFLKNTLNSEERQKVCSIACYKFFAYFMNTTLVKIFPFCCEPFIEPFFQIFVRIKDAVQRVRVSPTQTSGNWKESSLVSKPQGVKLPSLQGVANQFCCM